MGLPILVRDFPHERREFRKLPGAPDASEAGERVRRDPDRFEPRFAVDTFPARTDPNHPLAGKRVSPEREATHVENPVGGSPSTAFRSQSLSRHCSSFK